MMLGFQDYITFKEDTHQYFNPEGKEFKSVSKIIEYVTPDFDKAGISAMMAKSKAKEEGITVERAQDLILQDWDHKAQSAIDRGNWIHNGLEDYMLGKGCDEKIVPVAKQIAKFASKYYKFFPEAVVYDSEYGVAGTADFPVQRQRSKIPVIDVWDYKTNEAKGIYFDSIKRDKSGKFVKHYNRYLKAPLDHLEHTNFNTYSLQLALYAYMMEASFNVRIGRLGIIFINNDLKIKIYNVPYMKLEAKLLLEHHKSLMNASWED